MLTCRAMRWRPTVAVWAVAVTSFTAGAATIQITSVPAYGTSGSITGQVTGIADPQNYAVAPYLSLEGAGWYNKPTSAQPTVTINADGSFSANVSTGGNDPLATIYYVGLLPAGQSVPVPSGTAPAKSQFVATASYERYPASLSFAGRTWALKGSYVAGPGTNYFSASPADAWVDSAGLHLTVHNHDGHWWSTEAILPQHLGYGTYAFKTHYNVNALDPNLTFGAFTWDPYGQDTRIPAAPNREIDFEDGRWGSAADTTNSQVVVQPYTTNPPHRITIPDGVVTLTRFFTWQQGSVHFVTLLGDHSPTDYQPQDVISDYTFNENVDTGQLVPTLDSEMLHLNLWLNNSAAPANGQPAEVLVSDFSFTTLPEPTGVVTMVAFAMVALLWRRGRRVQAQPWGK